MLTICLIAIFNVKGVARSDKSTDNYYPTDFPSILRSFLASFRSVLAFPQVNCFGSLQRLSSVLFPAALTESTWQVGGLATKEPDIFIWSWWGPKKRAKTGLHQVANECGCCSVSA